MSTLKRIFSFDWLVVVAGLAVGVLAPILVKLGNPGNMGICVACFERDIAGALGLHSAAVVQYLRPEIPGFLLGSLLGALAFREFRPRGGAVPIVRLFLGAFGMVGALMFLGCPIRAQLRLGAGDLNALVGLAGLVAGAYLGVICLRRGFVLGRSRPLHPLAGYVLPLILGLFLLMVLADAYLPWLMGDSLLRYSQKGPGSQHAPAALSMLVGLTVGYLAQRSRLCTVGGIRDFLLIRDGYLLKGILAIIVGSLLSNLGLGLFKLGFAGQPIAHTHHLSNFFGLALTGWASVLLGGCPLRQLTLAGEGDTDAAVTVVGYVMGAAFAHNFLLASSPQGPTIHGQIAVTIGLVVMAAVGFSIRE